MVFICSITLTFHLLYTVPSCFREMMSHIENAKSSLDAFFILLRSDFKATEIVDAHKNGIRVRVITDYNMPKSSRLKLETLKKKGKKLLC